MHRCVFPTAAALKKKQQPHNNNNNIRSWASLQVLRCVRWAFKAGWCIISARWPDLCCNHGFLCTGASIEVSVEPRVKLQAAVNHAFRSFHCTRFPPVSLSPKCCHSSHSALPLSYTSTVAPDTGDQTIDKETVVCGDELSIWNDRTALTCNTMQTCNKNAQRLWSSLSCFIVQDEILKLQIVDLKAARIYYYKLIEKINSHWVLIV